MAYDERKADGLGYGLGKDCPDASENRLGSGHDRREKGRIQGGHIVSCSDYHRMRQLTSRIIAPLAVMEQWATEAKTKTVPGKLRVTTHHGPSRTKCAPLIPIYQMAMVLINSRERPRIIRCGHYDLSNRRIGTQSIHRLCPSAKEDHQED